YEIDSLTLDHEIPLRHPRLGLDCKDHTLCSRVLGSRDYGMRYCLYRMDEVFRQLPRHLICWETPGRSKSYWNVRRSWYFWWWSNRGGMAIILACLIAFVHSPDSLSSWPALAGCGGCPASIPVASAGFP